MNFRARGRRREEPNVDLTPMLDVTFNLVLFFVVTTSFVRADETPGIQVDLPRSSAQAIINDDRDINIWMTDKGAVYVDDEPVDAAALRAQLRERAKLDPDTLVVIKADENVTHGRVVQVMDEAKRFGLSRLAIATEGEGGGTAPAPTPAPAPEGATEPPAAP
ncbi:MAG: biopolymer transporter ExbD [Myxococcota bacterium]